MTIRVIRSINQKDFIPGISQVLEDTQLTFEAKGIWAFCLNCFAKRQNWILQFINEIKDYPSTWGWHMVALGRLVDRGYINEEELDLLMKGLEIIRKGKGES